MKTNNEKLIEVIESRKEDIIEMAKDVYASTMDGRYMHGMRVGIIADIDGNIYDFAWTAGTSNMAIYEGRAINVIDWNVHNEVGEITINREDMSDEEFAKFVEWLLKEEYISNVEDAESEIYYHRIAEFDEEMGTDIVDKVTAENIGWNTDYWYREASEEQIDIALEMLNRDMENWEE